MSKVGNYGLIILTKYESHFKVIESSIELVNHYIHLSLLAFHYILFISRECDRAYPLVIARGHSHLVHVIPSMELVREGSLEVICHPMECFEVEDNISKLCTCSFGIKVYFVMVA